MYAPNKSKSTLLTLFFGVLISKSVYAGSALGYMVNFNSLGEVLSFNKDFTISSYKYLAIVTNKALGPIFGNFQFFGRIQQIDDSADIFWKKKDQFQVSNKSKINKTNPKTVVISGPVIDRDRHIKKQGDSHKGQHVYQPSENQLHR